MCEGLGIGHLDYADADEIAAIYASAPIGLCVLDTQLRFVRINDRMAELNGVAASDHVGRSIHEVVPDLGPKAEADLRRVLAGETIIGVELSGETPAQPGVTRGWRENWMPLRDAAGDIVGISIAAEEITAEQDAARLAAMIRAIGETSPDLIYAKDRAGRMLYANPTTAAVIGVSAPQLIGHKAGDWASDDEQAKMIAATDQRVMTAGRQEIAEEPFTSPDGQYRVFRSAKSPIRDGRGEVVGLAGVSTDITAIRASEQASREGEERLRFALDAARMAAWSVDLSTGRSRRSANAAALFGPDPHSAAAFYEQVHPDDRDRLMALHAAVVAGTAEYDTEFRQCHPDGRWLWVAVRGRLTRDRDGHPLSLAGVMIDVTARKDAELAAERAAGEFEALAENVTQLAWMAEPDGHIFWYNRRWYEFTGTTLDDMLGWGWQKVHHPDHVDRVVASWSDHLKRGVAFDDTFPLRRADGVFRWFLTRSEPIRDAAGDIVRWFGTNTDVTEQIETAAALSQSEGQFRAMAEAIPSMLFIALPNGDNVYVNRFYIDYTGVSEDRLRGQGYLECVHPDDRRPSARAWLAATNGGGLYETEFRARRADGAWRWQLCRALPVRDGEGRIDRWVGTCTDIHDRRTAEAELQQRVTDALAERETALNQLHEAQKLETVGQLTGGVAHDFNNLLTPIVGSLDLLRRRVDDERLGRLIDGALSSAERARTLIQRLLSFARRATLQPRAVDPNAIVAGMRDLVESSLSPVIEYVTDVQPGLPPAMIDPNQLELALLNLSVNARDAMPAGGRLSWVVTEDVVARDRPGLKAGRYIRMAVSDTGVGMDTDTLARAIEPFFSTKPAGKGTGLGLSMVHGLAAQSGGLFRLESIAGTGTTAILWLPVADGAVAAPVREPDARAASRRATVLLVDDEEQVRFTTAESLIELGYEVEALASAQEALDRVKHGLRPELLVTDHLMPGMTGAQLALELRRTLPDLPILMITGYAQLGQDEAGGFDVLVKPYRHAELAVRIADLLSEEPVPQRSRR